MGTIINPAISINWIREVFGVSGTDLGTLMKKIADDGLVNIWAKYKPIYHSGVGLLTNSMRQDNSHVVSGYNISWGIKKPSSYGWSDFINTQTGEVKSGKWGYDKPVGGSASPWRLSDFAGIDNSGNASDEKRYSRDAVCPIQITLTQGDILPVPYESTEDGTTLMFLFTFQNGVTRWNANTCLSIGEIFASELNYYPTVVFTGFYNGRVYEYSKSGDNKVSYYTGNVNPVVQVPIDTKDIADAVTNDGGSYHNGVLADGVQWTVTMVLTSVKVAGTKTSHTIGGTNKMARLEYETGADRKILSVANTTKLDEIRSLSLTVTLKKNTQNTSYYYIQSVSVTIDTTGGDPINFNIDASFNCLIGVIGGSGWAGTNQQETKNDWSNLRLSTEERGRQITKTLSATPSLPEYRFNGSLPDGKRVAAGSISFRSSGISIYGSFGIEVQGGASTYTATMTLK